MGEEDNCPLPFLIAVNLLVTLLLHLFFMTLAPGSLSTPRPAITVGDILVPMDRGPHLPGVSLLTSDALPHHPGEWTLGFVMTYNCPTSEIGVLPSEHNCPSFRVIYPITLNYNNFSTSTDLLRDFLSLLFSASFLLL